MNIFQERYLAHQLRKKKILIKIMKKRYSERMFSDRPIPEKDIKNIIKTLQYCPSSCNRQAVTIRSVTERDEKALLGGLLVGGVGWVHRAPVILLLMADREAYIAGDEVTYMPYLDAGVMVQQLWLATTAYGLKCAFVNPNIREMNKDHFNRIFGNKLFCGALAIGYTL